MWEEERHEWGKLRAMGSARQVPAALKRLIEASSADEARKHYWQVDNCVVVQGSLYEAALPMATCLVSILHRCSRVARPNVLELLAQISGGEVDPSEERLGNVGLREACVREISRGFGFYLGVLEDGTDEERSWCIDIIGACARDDASLRVAANWYFSRLTKEPVGEWVQKLLMDWMLELGQHGT